jgi:hypothetical protein
MKLAVLAIALLVVASAARANSITNPTGCFTLQPGQSIITSLPPCPPAGSSIVVPPPPVVDTGTAGDDNAQGDENEQGDLGPPPPSDGGFASIEGVNNPVSPVGVPEPSTLPLVALGAAAIFLARSRRCGTLSHS